MDNKITFEQAIEKLENEVRRLEDGNMSLDSSLASFEEAVRLAKICNERLEAAEQRVRILTATEDGTVTDAPFAGAEDET